MVKLSIFTTMSEPTFRGDLISEPLNCYTRLADEVIILDGGGITTQIPDWTEKITRIEHLWPKEFIWPFIGQQFQRGYEACTGDVVIHADLDFIFHEKDFEAIRQVAQKMLDEKQPAMSFYKWQFVLPDRYNLKSRLVVMVNKRDFGNRIKFNSSGDLCQPSLDDKYISPDDVPEAEIPFYNYEKLTKTKEQIMDDVGRMERAYKRYFGHTQYGSDGTDEVAFNKWYEAQRGKLNKPQKHIKLEDHPKYIQDTIKNLTPEQFGHSMFGLQENDYAS